MKKIKILRIITRLNIGGPAIHAILLTEGLDKSKFQSLLVSGSISKYEADMLDYAYERNVKPVFIPELKRRLHFVNDISAFRKIYNIIKMEEPDIIHTHTAKAGTLGRLAGIFYRCLKPVAPKRTILIHTFHGHIFDGYFNKFQTQVFILIERFLAVFTHKIITVSDSIKDQLRALRICKKNKIDVIPLGLELDKFLQVSVKDNTIFNIGIVGRLAPIKNHRLFLEAAARVTTDNPKLPLRFKIIGDGELRKDLEEYAYRLDINRYVDFLGWQKDLVNVYSNLDIVALTSKNEGTPVSLIEAMASGRAVVATDVGGVKDLLGKESPDFSHHGRNFKVLERGIIAKSCDKDSFSSALSYILRDSRLREDIVFCARAFVRESFTKERLIRDIEALYGRILN